MCEHEVVPAGCDMHLQSRALQTAVEAAFGTYNVGHVHVIAVAYVIAHALDADWALYKPLLNRQAGAVAAPDTIKCDHPVVTRWFTVCKAAAWNLQNLEHLRFLANSYTTDFRRSSGRCATSGSRWTTQTHVQTPANVSPSSSPPPPKS